MIFATDPHNNNIDQPNSQHASPDHKMVVTSNKTVTNTTLYIADWTFNTGEQT